MKQCGFHWQKSGVKNQKLRLKLAKCGISALEIGISSSKSGS